MEEYLRVVYGSDRLYFISSNADGTLSGYWLPFDAFISRLLHLEEDGQLFSDAVMETIFEQLKEERE